MISYGLIGGLRYPDMQEMTPGEVVDYFIYRRSYDESINGIRRE